MRCKYMRRIHIITVVILLLIGMVCTASYGQASGDGAKTSGTILNITRGDASKSYTMEEIKSMPSAEASGCLRREDGTIEGPFHLSILPIEQ
jgi:hypothetical protein